MPESFTASDHQRHRIFNTLFKILERQGCAIEQGEKQKLFVVLEGEKIEFQLRDKFKQVRRPLTTEEKRWRFSSEKTWKQELQPTGKLIFVIKAYLPTGIRTEWLETTEAAIEEYLPDIVASFIAAGSLLAEKLDGDLSMNANAVLPSKNNMNKNGFESVTTIAGGILSRPRTNGKA